MFTDNMKHLLNFFLIMLITFSQAKKVKFSVDMNGQEVNNNGIHVSGDFQVAAGYPSNWDAQSTPMLKEGNTEIYSVIVNIPAFKKYEYKFVNGDQFYEVEVVPEKSRVGFEFIDNRWFYLDSISNDTTIMPAFLFGSNAPEGKFSLRFKVNMISQSTIDKKGVHVVGNFNKWQYNYAYMYSFDGNIYEYIAILDSTNYEYRFLNGDLQSKLETISGSCVNVDGNRFLNLFSDTVIDVVCYQKCTNCSTQNINKNEVSKSLIISPNPAKDYFIINFPFYVSEIDIAIFDVLGKNVFEVNKISGLSIKFDTPKLRSGMYWIKIRNFSDNNNSFVLFLENK